MSANIGTAISHVTRYVLQTCRHRPKAKKSASVMQHHVVYPLRRYLGIVDVDGGFFSEESSNTSLSLSLSLNNQRFPRFGRVSTTEPTTESLLVALVTGLIIGSTCENNNNTNYYYNYYYYYRYSMNVGIQVRTSRAFPSHLQELARRTRLSTRFPDSRESRYRAHATESSGRKEALPEKGL